MDKTARNKKGKDMMKEKHKEVQEEEGTMGGMAKKRERKKREERSLFSFSAIQCRFTQVLAMTYEICHFPG